VEIQALLNSQVSLKDALAVAVSTALGAFMAGIGTMKIIRTS
jgi:hypothetical protein